MKKCIKCGAGLDLFDFLLRLTECDYCRAAIVKIEVEKRIKKFREE